MDNIPFVKYNKNPVFGNIEMGTCFDVYVTHQDGRYRMDFSWRAKSALAVTFSNDGINWESPQITLESDTSTGWEDNINRSCVLQMPDGKYKIWYTGQARGYSFIGCAESSDGLHFKRTFSEPVLIAERPWENTSVMNPCILYENGIYRMWYSAGETIEPNVIAYAESSDGFSWNKSRINPIFVEKQENIYEQNRIGGCQVIHTDDMGYLMFYIGYEDIDTARICCARSDNGITQWQRCELNPIVSTSADSWDADACYKPSVIWNAEQDQWMLWYNGRHGLEEYIGLVLRKRRMLF